MAVHIQSPTWRFLAGALLIGLGLGTAACDPGRQYRPAGWAQIDEYRWQKSFDGLEVATRGVGGITATPGVWPELTITNRTAVTVIFVRATLRTEVGEFHSVEVPAEKRSFVRPGQTERIAFAFNFGRPMGEVLVGDVELTVRAIRGEEPIVIPIAMERD